MYYLRNKERGYLGNSFIWWSKNDCGYTAYLENAEKFCEDEAKEMVRNNPEKWEIYPCSLIEKQCHIIFDSQDVPYLEKPTENSWPVVDVTKLLKQKIELPKPVKVI